MTWEIELTAKAAGQLRKLHRDSQRSVAARLDHLESSGIPDAASRLPGLERVSCVRAGDYEILCTAEESSRKIVIAGIEPASTTAPRTLARAITYPVRSAATRAARRHPVVARLGGWLGDLGMDLRFAFRSLRRNRGFALFTIAILGIGIGGNTAVFSVVNNVFLAALPFAEGDRVVRIRNYTLGPNGEALKFNVAPLDFYAVRERNSVFVETAAQDGRNFTLTSGDEPLRVSGVVVSENWGPMLGIGPAVGRYFSEEEEALGLDARVALISHGLWQRVFGGRSGILGESLMIEGEAHTVIGIMPQSFNFPYDAEMWLPAHFDRHDGRSHDYNVLARLRPGATLESARADLARIAADLRLEFPETHEGIYLDVTWARENFIENQDQIVLALLAAVGFLLLIACVNVANLLVARFNLRGKEIGIRAALGAGRGRQFRQFLTETLLLFLLGGAVGLVLTVWSKSYLTVLIPSVLSDQLALGEVRIDGRVIAFTGLVSVLGGLAFGALAAARASRPDVRSLLSMGGRWTAAGGRRLQGGLVITEVALALVLLMGAGLMIKNFRQLQTRELGFPLENLVTLRMSLEGERYSDAARRSNLMREILQRVRNVPGVRAAGTTSDNPVCCGDWGARIEVKGLNRDADDPPIIVFHRYVTPGFFETMDIPLVRGRTFTAEDDQRAAPVVIVDERMARHFWPGQDPIGKQVRPAAREDDPRWYTVVGVVGAVDDDGDYQDTWYLPFFAHPMRRAAEQVHLMVRVAGDPEGIVPGVRQAILEAAPTTPTYDVALMSELRTEAISQDRLGAVIGALFGGFGLLLAAFGIYGVMSYVVGQRDHEIGTRIALGAGRGDVIGMVVGQTLRLALAGAALGVLGALALNRVMAALITDLESLDAMLLAGAATGLLAVALAAAFVPARRAASVDPVQAFRA